MLVFVYFIEFFTIEFCGRDEFVYWIMRYINFFLIFSGVAEGSVWNMVMKVLGLRMVIGLIGFFGFFVLEFVEEGCFIESVCVRILSKYVLIFFFTNE